MLGGGVSAHVRMIQRSPGFKTAPCAELNQGGKIVPIGRRGVCAQAAFLRQVRYKSIDPRALARIHDASQRIRA
jgi:hypothetical protein